MGIRLLSGNSPDMLREVWDVSLLLLAALSHVCVCDRPEDGTAKGHFQIVGHVQTKDENVPPKLHEF